MAKAKQAKKTVKKPAVKEASSKAKKTATAAKKAATKPARAEVKKAASKKKITAKAPAKSVKSKSSSLSAKDAKAAKKPEARTTPTKILTKSSKADRVSGAKSQTNPKSSNLKNLKKEKVAALAVKHLETRESVSKPRPAVVFDPTMAALSETANTPLEKLAKKWNSLFKKASKIETKPYNMRKVFEEKTAIEHKTMGWGYILSNKNDRLEVLFKDGVRFLISNYQG